MLIRTSRLWERPPAPESFVPESVVLLGFERVKRPIDVPLVDAVRTADFPVAVGAGDPPPVGVVVPHLPAAAPFALAFFWRT